METIRSCLGVMVEQTRSSSQFWDSLQFLKPYKTLSLDFIERLIRRESDSPTDSCDSDQ